MNLDKTSVLIGIVHVLIGSFIQFYARPYKLRLSHYTLPLFFLIFVLVLFLSGYFAHNLYEKKGYLSPLAILLLWILIGCAVFIMNIDSYPVDRFSGLGGNSEFARTVWVFRYIGYVIPAPVPAPAPDYYVSSLWLIITQLLGISIEKLGRVVSHQRLKS